MSDRTNAPWRPRLVVVGALISAGIAVTVLVWPSSDVPNKPGSAAPDFPIPPFSETRFQNTGNDARYIGIAACADCHKEQHASYVLTAHSRALAVLDPQTEPPDTSLRHAPSGRDYKVYREGGQFRHEELLKDEAGREVARVDLPVKYLIGSGNFCRSYLVEVDGFLHESPLTWYTAKKKWEMSPGYDFPEHWSFERPATIGCLNCHAGRVEPVDGSVHRMTIHERAIGCERCHGPGSLHAERHRTDKTRAAGEDRTIVNPARLSRPLLESICAECHLNGPAVVALRGRGPIDFRPGRPLADYRVDYRFDSGSEQMTVVGHIEQLRRSRCYQRSESLTCITCHDPHAHEQPKDKVAFFRQKCLDCHADRGCSVPADERVSKERDNCAACHMPRGDTDIPHIAFTHHRIGKHVAAKAAAENRVPELVPTSEMSGLSPIDQKRNLGLAYHRTADRAEFERYAEVFRDRSRSLLEEVHEAGLRDGPTAEALAEFHWKKDVSRARSLAREALDSPDLAAEARAKALMILASCDFEEQNYKGAIAHLEQLVRLRRLAEDWRFLGVSYLLDNRPQEALRAMQTALAIRPSRPDVQGGMYEIYRRLGDPRRAQEYLNRAQWLDKHHQQ
jgi:hypothetical protein